MSERPLAAVITPLMGRLACRVGLHAPSLYHERAGLRFLGLSPTVVHLAHERARRMGVTPRPLVSVITPTWQRSELLRGCIENVRAQSYRPLEHVIVSDGRDDELVSAMRRWGFVSAMRLAEAGCDAGNVDVPIQTVHLGRNWSTYLPSSFCAAPINVGMRVASGDYQTWLADDERMEPDHIVGLVDALEAAGADFAYGRVRMYHVGQSPEHGYEIGSSPPQLGQITNALYRADLLRKSDYPYEAGMVSDWACIHRWIADGATWAYVPRVTLTHRVDH